MIKSVASAGIGNSKPYPKLMISRNNGAIVLMIGENSGRGIGTVVFPIAGGPAIGCYADDWSMAVFKDYPGMVTLNNE